MVNLITCSHCNKQIPDQDRAITISYRQTITLDGADHEMADAYERSYCRVCFLAGAGDMKNWNITSRAASSRENTLYIERQKEFSEQKRLVEARLKKARSND